MAEQIQETVREVADEIINSDTISTRTFEGTAPNSQREINKGYCADFAYMVVERTNLDVRILFVEAGPSGHAWLEYDGYHYDAESPEGVEDWRELPYNRRKPIVQEIERPINLSNL